MPPACKQRRIKPCEIETLKKYEFTIYKVQIYNLRVGSMFEHDYFS